MLVNITGKITTLGTAKKENVLGYNTFPIIERTTFTTFAKKRSTGEDILSIGINGIVLPSSIKLTAVKSRSKCFKVYPKLSSIKPKIEAKYIFTGIILVKNINNIQTKEGMKTIER
jgi:hypothetical protein